MSSPYWKCAICGFEAENNDEKLKHIQESRTDPEHQFARYEELQLKEFLWMEMKY